MHTVKIPIMISTYFPFFLFSACSFLFWLLWELLKKLHLIIVITPAISIILHCLWQSHKTMHCISWAVLQNIINCLHRFDSLQWRHNGRDGVSNHQPHGCLLNLYSDADQRKHQSSALLAFVWGIHRWPVNSRTIGQWRGKCFHLMTSSCSAISRWCPISVFVPLHTRDTICGTQIVTLSDSNELTGKCNRSTNDNILFKIQIQLVLWLRNPREIGWFLARCLCDLPVY